MNTIAAGNSQLFMPLISGFPAFRRIFFNILYGGRAQFIWNSPLFLLFGWLFYLMYAPMS